MSHAEAFLEAIRAEPGDETHRLVYADWLEDRGDPRGAFIHAQCRLEALTADHPDRLALEEQVQDLLAAHGDEWAGPVRDRVSAFQFRRGFIESITLSPEVLVQDGAALFAFAPIREVHLALATGAQAAVVAGCPFLSRVARLDVSGHFLEDNALETLLASPYLSRLIALRAASNHLTSRWLADPEKYPGLARLEELDVSNNYPTYDRPVQLLAGTRLAGRLRALNLHHTGVTANGILALLAPGRFPNLTSLDVPVTNGYPSARAEQALAEMADSPLLTRLTRLGLRSSAVGTPAGLRLLSAPLPRLRELDLAGCYLAPDCWRALAHSPRLGPVHVLDLSGNRVPSEALTELAESPNLAHVTALHLAHNALQDRAAKALAASPHLTRLTRLDLARNEIGGPGIVALAGSPNLARLTFLDLSQNYVGSRGVQALAGSPHLRRLTHLALNDNRLEPGTAEALADSPNLTHLTALHLQSNRLGDAGVQALARSPYLGRLTTLTLNGNRVGREGVEELLASPILERLRVLDLRNNEICGDDGERLRQRFGPGVQW